jgi:pyruvate dehydrogenase E2 component (dihydrolipoamide acetyltransferase)
MAEFRLPDLGEGVTEAEIDRWLVTEGQTIEEDDLLVEVITDKAMAEIPSPFAGIVSKIHVGEGDIVPVGTVLISIDKDGAAASEEVRTASGSAQAPQDAPQAATAPPRSPPPARDDDGQVKAMPPVRKLARELGVDITQIAGSGPDGRIVRADVEAVAGRAGAGPGGRPPVPSPAAPAVGGRRVPLRGVRRMIAEHMAHAHSAIPPVTHVEECDVTELDAARKLANDRNLDGAKLTFLPFIVKSVVSALKGFPELNSTLDEEAGEIVYHDRYDIGVAAETPQGLVVPVVRAADAKPLREIAAEIDRLARGARDGKLKLEELRGSTFTITSPGQFGGLMATPIINYPEAAILGVHRATERPVVRDGQIVARLMMNLSITFDHRVVDGVTAAKFCLEVVKLLEHPAALLLEA